MTGDPATCRLLEEAGVGAIVLPSLFEEEILNEELELDRSLDAGTDQFGEALSYFPNLGSFKGVGDRYLARLEKTKGLLTIPVIASLNAATPGGWVRYARLMQDAGADALELNLYHVVADPAMTGAEREATDLELIAAVRAAVSIPLAVKLSPYYSALAGFAADAVAAGADGLVLFNRFYQPDLDLDTFDVVTKVGLSHPSELRLPLRWIAILRPQLGEGVGLAATSGVHSGTDAVKALLVGADVAMTASARPPWWPRAGSARSWTASAAGWPSGTTTPSPRCVAAPLPLPLRTRPRTSVPTTWQRSTPGRRRRTSRPRRFAQARRVWAAGAAHTALGPGFEADARTRWVSVSGPAAGLSVWASVPGSEPCSAWAWA